MPDVHVIRIKPETYARLQSWARPLTDTANDALERALDAAEVTRTTISKRALKDYTMDALKGAAAKPQPEGDE